MMHSIALTESSYLVPTNNSNHHDRRQGNILTDDDAADYVVVDSPTSARVGSGSSDSHVIYHNIVSDVREEEECSINDDDDDSYDYCDDAIFENLNQVHDFIPATSTTFLVDATNTLTFSTREDPPFDVQLSLIVDDDINSECSPSISSKNNDNDNDNDNDSVYDLENQKESNVVKCNISDITSNTTTLQDNRLNVYSATPSSISPITAINNSSKDSMEPTSLVGTATGATTSPIVQVNPNSNSTIDDKDCETKASTIDNLHLNPTQPHEVATVAYDVTMKASPDITLNDAKLESLLSKCLTAVGEPTEIQSNMIDIKNENEWITTGSTKSSRRSNKKRRKQMKMAKKTTIFS